MPKPFDESPSFQGVVCPHCAKLMDAPLPSCPHCGGELPTGESFQLDSAPQLPRQRLRWLLRPQTILVAVLTVAVTLGLYGYIYVQQMSSDFYIMEGDRLAGQGDYAAAIRSYQMAAYLDPQNPQVNENLGWLEYRQAHDPEALKYFEKAIALEAGRATSLYGAGLAAYQTQNYQGAASYLEQAAALNAGLPNIHEYLGLAEYRLGKYEPAYEHLNAARASSPQSGTILYYLARLQILRGETYLAIENFTQAEKFGFDSGAVSLARGLAWMKAGEYLSARDDLQKAVTQLSGRKDAVLFLAKAYYLLGDYSAAQAQIASIQSNIPAHLQYEFLSMPGFIALRQGNLESAQNTFAQIANMMPDDADALNALGWTVFYSGNCAAARSNFEKAAVQTNGEPVFAYDSFFAPNETPQNGLSIACPAE
jgi:tetratricopeptide (TPR) repeat protein